MIFKTLHAKLDAVLERLRNNSPVAVFNKRHASEPVYVVTELRGGWTVTTVQQGELVETRFYPTVTELLASLTEEECE